jgi:hypothetical protein
MFDIKYMCWYTDFLFVISIKYDFKYLLKFIHSILAQKQENLTLKINCGLGVHWHLPWFENKLGYYKHRYFFYHTSYYLINN